MRELMQNKLEMLTHEKSGERKLSEESNKINERMANLYSKYRRESSALPYSENFFGDSSNTKNSTEDSNPD